MGRRGLLLLLSLAFWLSWAVPGRADLIANPDNVVLLYGYAATSGKVLSFVRRNPDGTTAPAVFPAGKVMVIREITATLSKASATSNDVYFVLSPFISGGEPVTAIFGSKNQYWVKIKMDTGFVIDKPPTSAYFFNNGAEALIQGKLYVHIRGYFLDKP
jgi:hypothetical protein